MRVLNKILPVWLLAILALLVVDAAHAQTPTPTSVLTPTATSVPLEPALFIVVPWVNGQNTAHGNVTARIGETLCATGVPLVLPGGSRVDYSLSVPSQEAVPGCGYEGAVVTFFVDGRQAPQTAIWRSGGAGDPSRIINAIIGPPFAHFITISEEAEFEPGRSLVPYIGGKACGYGGVVYSNELEPGCGVEGAEVTFKLLDAQGNVVAVAKEKGTWHAWDGMSDPQLLNLTFEPAGGITMPGTGTGDEAGRAASWGHLAVALASVGMAGGIAAAAFRRRAMTR